MLKNGWLKNLILLILAVALISIGSLIARMFKEVKSLQRSEYIMGTLFDITALGDNDKSLEEAAKNAFAEIKRIDALMSRYKEDSKVSLINKNAGIRPVKVSKELIEILKIAKKVSELSNGAFDVTIGPLSNLWGFDEDRDDIPSLEEIERLRRLVDYRKLKIDEAASTVYLEKNGMMIDLGGIAKGYALSGAINVFEDAGVKDIIIDAGGNLNLRGGRKGKPWRIGIQDPRNEKDLLGALNITDTSVSTSGDYQRYFIKNGVRYHHILDPKTGFPVSGLTSVTALGRDEALTDALSTAVFILGEERGIALMKKLNIEGVVVREDGKVIISDGLKGKFTSRKE